MASFILDTSKPVCSYFAAYVKVKGLKDGDEWVGHEYVSWIVGKHTEFKKLIGIDRYSPYTPEQQRAFERFLTEGRGVDA